MEFNEKLQGLRKRHGLTQEALAQRLFVSRAAVSRWESGRGYPGIDSLKAIADCFSVTVDELLSADETLPAAEAEDSSQKGSRLDPVFGLLDCSAGLLLFLPFFGQRAEGLIRSVSLLALTGTAPYLKALYLVFILGSIAAGLLTIGLQSRRSSAPLRSRHALSLLLTGAGTVLFTVSLQPYPAVFLFLVLSVKILMLLKQR